MEDSVSTDIDWRHFVAYAVFLMVSFVWVQARRRSNRAVTAIGIVGFVAAFWTVLRIWR